MKNSMKRRIQEFLYRSIHEANGDIDKKLNEILESAALLGSLDASVCDLQGQVKELSARIEDLKGSQGKHFGYQQAAALYAYRYLLNREPEDIRIIENNLLDWKQLRENILNCPEYRIVSGSWVSPGHFYSPIPNRDDIKEFFEAHPEGYPVTALTGVDFNLEKQYELCADFAKTNLDNFWPVTPPPPPEGGSGRKYFVKNDFFSIVDAIVYFNMIQKYKPKRIIEIGSGFSSAVALDVNEAIRNNQMDCTFIEPYPERLYSLLSDEDKSRENIRIVEHKLQDVDLSIFKELVCGDILFVDSTHVSKFNSDVNYILFQILPSLQKGVLIHFHDIYYPFDYPKSWLMEGRAWNEAYMLHSFLQYNNCFSIKFWMSLLLRCDKEKINFLGKYSDQANYTCSLWLERQ